MSSDPLGGPIVLILILMLLYGRLISAQTALRLLNESRLRREAESGDLRSRQLLPLAEAPEEPRSALKVCSTLTGVIACGIAVYWFVPPLCSWLAGAGLPLRGGWLSAFGVLIVGLIFSLLLLCFCSMLPRRIAELRPEETAKRSLTGIRVATVLIRPIVKSLYAVSSLVMKLFGFRAEDAQEEVTEEDIRDMVDMGSETGAIEVSEKELIENIFKFNNHTAEDVMTHRTDVTALWEEDDRDTVIRTILETGYSRFPVYREDMDDIIGVLNTRDWLLNNQQKNPKPLHTLLREAYFVPETVQADVLFRDMQQRKVHMAIVVDEYGGMSGVVTMEDLLEEIVGDIYDEFDEQENAAIMPLGENQWRIEGTAPLEDVAEALHVELPTEEDYDTLGGLVFSQLTTIPQDGSKPVVEACGLRIQVERIEDHRVESALVSKILPPNDTEPS